MFIIIVSISLLYCLLAVSRNSSFLGYRKNIKELFCGCILFLSLRCFIETSFNICHTDSTTSYDLSFPSSIKLQCVYRSDCSAQIYVQSITYVESDLQTFRIINFKSIVGQVHWLQASLRCKFKFKYLKKKLIY